MDTLLHFIRNLYEHGYQGDPGLVDEEFYIEQLAELLRILGFTQEDVKKLRVAASNCAANARHEMELMRPDRHNEAARAAEFYTNLADRIEALLPPGDGS